jgi:DNA-binding transcriptional ArsR family regulator
MASDIASIAGLFGQPARAAMCQALLSDRALTATELATVAGISQATAAEHLRQLVDGGVLSVVSQGRHRYHRLASAEVAEALEALARLAPPIQIRSLRQSATAAALAEARSCYDHVAGRLGVRLYESMLATDVLTQRDGGLALGPNRAPLHRLGIDPSRPRRGRPLLRECLDWTERRPHLAGAMAAELLTGLLQAGWLTRTPRPRALALTSSGVAGLAELDLLDSS